MPIHGVRDVISQWAQARGSLAAEVNTTLCAFTKRLRRRESMNERSSRGSFARMRTQPIT
jgi:hypothetical protein